MIKLLQIPILNYVKRLIIMSEKEIFNLDLAQPLDASEYDNLFIGAEEKKEKIPTMVQLRVHTLKGGEK